MIAEIGHALLWLAAACAVMQAVAGLLPAARLPALTVPAAITGGWLWLWVAAALIAVFWTGDRSVAGVAATTRSDLPGALRLAAIVVQDGGWLVVATALAAWGGAVLAFLHAPARAVGGAGVVAALLAGALLLGTQPFARLVPAPTEGAGFPSAARARLAALAPPGSRFADVTLRLGERVQGVTLAAITPVAGPDSTGVAAVVRVGGTVLVPEWRETAHPLAGFAVADSSAAAAGWFAARIMPAADGRWRVEVTRLSWLWLAPPLLLLGGPAWRRR